MNCSPYPACVITARATRSISWQGDAGPDRLEGRLLGLADDAVHLDELRARLADADGARGVGAVAVHEPAEVQDHGVALLDDPFAGLVVRVGAVGARPDDREVDLFVPELAQQPGEVGRDLVLAPTGEAQPEDLEEGGVGRRAGRRQPGQLVVVLDRPQHRQALGHRLVARAGSSSCRPRRCIAQAESETA